jgi:hypothetical protein
MTEAAIPEPTPEQAALFARVRRMMLIAGLTTAVAVGAGGTTEIRTFDAKTLKPAGRLKFVSEP